MTTLLMCLNIYIVSFVIAYPHVKKEILGKISFLEFFMVVMPLLNSITALISLIMCVSDLFEKINAQKFFEWFFRIK